MEFEEILRLKVNIKDLETNVNEIVRPKNRHRKAVYYQGKFP